MRNDVLVSIAELVELLGLGLDRATAEMEGLEALGGLFGEAFPRHRAQSFLVKTAERRDRRRQLRGKLFLLGRHHALGQHLQDLVLDAPVGLVGTPLEPVVEWEGKASSRRLA